ncbi:MAG: hypothetical protein HY889_03125 [Deltaproteobacteria bacterium]|nr:hypothetical protein [Deltaproteobacteria bacterium]
MPLTTITPVLANGITTATGADAGYRFSCSRLSSGKVFCWGNNSYGQLGSGTGISSMTPTEVVK